MASKRARKLVDLVAKEKDHGYLKKQPDPNRRVLRQENQRCLPRNAAELERQPDPRRSILRQGNQRGPPRNPSELGFKEKVASWLQKVSCRKRLAFPSPKKVPGKHDLHTTEAGPDARTLHSVGVAPQSLASDAASAEPNSQGLCNTEAPDVTVTLLHSLDVAVQQTSQSHQIVAAQLTSQDDIPSTAVSPLATTTVVGVGAESATNNSHDSSEKQLDQGYKKKLASRLQKGARRKRLAFPSPKKVHGKHNLHTTEAGPDARTHHSEGVAPQSLASDAASAEPNSQGLCNTEVPDVTVTLLHSLDVAVQHSRQSHQTVAAQHNLQDDIPSTAVSPLATITVVGVRAESATNNLNDSSEKQLDQGFSFADSVVTGPEIEVECVLDCDVNIIEGTTTPSGARVIFQEPSPVVDGFVTAQNDVDNENVILPPEPVPEAETSSVTGALEGDGINHVGNDDFNDFNCDERPHRTPNCDSRKRTRTPGSSTSPVRKRTNNPSMWKCNIRKSATNTGQEYVSSRGKIVSAKQRRPACACKYDCVHRITEERRQIIFSTFWGLGDHERQWEFIRSNSTSQPTKVKNDEQDPKRACSRKFFFKVDGEKVMVCKKMFMATLSIWDCWIDSAYGHLNLSKGKTATPDKRGRHKNHPKHITPEKIKTVKDHVAEFPRVPSHYCRQRTKREYLENGLSLKKMSKLYLSWAESKNFPATSVASCRQYEDIVNAHFNLGFFKPKKDQCKLCSLMRSKHNTPAIREKYKNLWVSHIRNKDLLKKIKERDKAAAEKDRTVALCSFDLQKQLSCPKSEASPFFYRSKLNVFNFTIFNSVTRFGFCYLWHEGMAKKGSDEVASSLLHFINEFVGKGYKEFIFYSDNCGGQNKNRYIFSMYELAAVLYSIKITHKFLEPGHTMMEVDSIHARIEKSTKDKEIFDFDEWVKAIQDAKEELPKYEVIPFKRNFVRTFKPVVQMQNWETDTTGQKIAWQQVKEVQINGSEGNLVRIKYEHGGDAVTLSPNKAGRPVSLRTYKPPQAYDESIPLSANTMKDLKFLCDSLAIPAAKHAFYNAVLAGCTGIGDELTSDSEYDTEEEICIGEALEDENCENEDT